MHARAAAIRYNLGWKHAALSVALFLGLALRCALVIGRLDVIYPDEIFQYSEPAHRLVFGSGVVAWEFIVGIRSWLVPGFVSGVMKVASWFGDNPLFYIQSVRILCALLSLSVVICGFFMALRSTGAFWAGATALLCAVWYQSLFFAPSFVDEVLAAFATFPAVMLAEGAGEDHGRRAAAIGVLLGLAFCLRYQMAPALLLVASWYGRAAWRERWLPMILAGLAVVVPVLGLLDAFTWGAPFQSVWRNFEFNALKGVSSSFGRTPWYAYARLLAWPDDIAAVPIIGLVLFGSIRAPLLALTAATVLLVHSSIPHKEYRFVCFVVMSVPILLGLGLSVADDFLARRFEGKAARIAAGTLAVFLFGFSSYGFAHLQLRFANDGVLDAFAAAHDAPGMCGLGVADLDWPTGGGYTYLNRDVPIYFDVMEPPARVVRENRLVPQFAPGTLLAHTEGFNYVIAPRSRAVPGFAVVDCYPSARNGPSACLLRRPGACAG